MWNLKFAIGPVQIGASADMTQPLLTQICHYPMTFKAILKMAHDSTTFSWLLKTNATPNFFLLTKVPLSSKKNWLHLNSPKFIFFQKLWFLGACSRLSFKNLQPGQKKIIIMYAYRALAFSSLWRKLAEDVKKNGSETKGLSDHKRTTLKKTFKRIFVEHAYAQEGRGKRRDLHDVHHRRKLFKKAETKKKCYK